MRCLDILRRHVKSHVGASERSSRLMQGRMQSNESLDRSFFTETSCCGAGSSSFHRPTKSCPCSPLRFDEVTRAADRPARSVAMSPPKRDGAWHDEVLDSFPAATRDRGLASCSSWHYHRPENDDVRFRRSSEGRIPTTSWSSRRASCPSARIQSCFGVFWCGWKRWGKSWR
jgi:hypothetical protein